MLQTPVSITIPSLPTLIMWAVGGLAAHMGLTAWVVDAVLERKWMKLYEACEDRVNPRIRLALQKELAMIAEHENKLTLFSNKLETGFASHTLALQAGLSSQTDALKSVVDTLVSVQKEATETAKAVARIEGRLEHWNGDNRRMRTRRSDDLHHD